MMKGKEKRILAFILTAIMLLAVMPVLSFPMRAKADEDDRDFYDDFYIEQTEDSVIITGYKGTADVIAIPGTIHYLPVKIDMGVFSNCKSITSIGFGDICEIGDNAFDGCDNLQNVTFNGDVGDIGELAFKNCSSLTSVTFEKEVSNIGLGAFSGCDNLEKVIFKGTAGEIGKNAFDGCGKLQDVTFHEEVGDIGDKAFNNCVSLIRMIFYGDVGDIGDCAFENCDSLQDIYFQGEVGNIGKSAFSGCDSLGGIVFPGDIGNIGDEAFMNCKSFSAVIFGNVGDIGERAFAGCEAGHMVFSGNVGVINEGAFENCSFTEVRFPDNLRDMPDTVDLGNNFFPLVQGMLFLGDVVEIKESAFLGNHNFTVLLPRNTIIDEHSFEEEVEVLRYDRSYSYTGQPISISILNGAGEALTEGVDYEAVYVNGGNIVSEIKDPGDYIVYFSNFVDDSTPTLQIDWKAVGKVTVNPLVLTEKNVNVNFSNQTFTFDGSNQASKIKKAIKVVPQGFDNEISSKNYTVSFSNDGGKTFKDNLECLEAGSYVAKIIVNDTYISGEFTKKFDINPKSIANGSISVNTADNLIYDGTPKTPNVVVKDGEITLTQDNDYTVSYDNNIFVSRDEKGNVVAKAKITITGKVNYKDRIEQYFTINPKNLTITADSETKCIGNTVTKGSYTSSELVNGDEIKSVVITGSQSLLGSSENIPSDARIYNSDNKDVTDCYDIKYVNGTLTVKDHVFDQEIATKEHFASSATPSSPEKYYKSCLCGENSSETFEVGDPEDSLIIFVNDDGTELQKMEVAFGETPKYDDTPQKASKDNINYIFKGWTPDVVPACGDAVYTAQYDEEEIIYTIYFETNGGKLDTNSASTNSQFKLDTLPVPVLEGYDFIGWFSTSDNSKITKETVFTKDTVVYAKWEEITEPEEPEEEEPEESETPPNYLDELYLKLAIAAELGGKQEVYWNVGDSLPYDVLHFLELHPDITLVFEYTYLDVNYKVILIGEELLPDPTVPWAGPWYLLGVPKKQKNQ
ncbi:MAG: leucine-rich repeat protein [Lachnospiraceae bacterium]|nr:leucine-rich repeat protein [Lachnospiraceae bacterium]